jgi:hypothetical protein
MGANGSIYPQAGGESRGAVWGRLYQAFLIQWVC